MVANGKPGSNGETATNGEKSSHTSVMNGSHHHESSSHVTQSITRQREITVTKEYHRRLVVSTKVEIPNVESEESFLNFVANERLHRMPHRGSRWDKILRWAEYFATQVSALHEAVSSFVPNSTETAQVVWAGCRILLQVSPSRICCRWRCLRLTNIRWARTMQMLWIRYSGCFTNSLSRWLPFSDTAPFSSPMMRLRTRYTNHMQNY